MAGADYMDWYAGVFSPGNLPSIKWGLQNQNDVIGAKAQPAPIKVPGIFDASNWGLGATSNADKPRGERDVTLPDGTVIKSSGNAATDFLNGILGTSPLAGKDDYQTPEGESVAPGTGGILDTSGFGEWFGRIAVIILGFIFVAVGLSMFKGNVIEIAKNAVTG